MADNVGTYRPICPNAPIPPDAIAGIQDEARQLLRIGEIDSGTQRLEELNGWLQVNGQFRSFGVDIDAFVVETISETCYFNANAVNQRLNSEWKPNTILNLFPQRIWQCP